MKTMLTVMLVAGTAVSLRAQTQELTEFQRLRLLIDQQGAADQKKTVEFVAGRLISNQPVKGAPFSAEAVMEKTQTLADGNRIVQRTSSKQFRDSEGRERQEETASMGAIFINDPVAHLSYTLHPDSRTAEKSPLAGATITSHVYNGENKPFYFSNFEQFRDGLSLLQLPAGFAIAQGRGTRSQATSDADAGNVKEEQLGAIQMEGVLAQGTRTTTTIPAGQIGNDRPINVIYERWYSPDLQLTVMTKLSDPRSGETVYKLTNIVRVEQVRSLFEVPSDYTVAANPVVLQGIVRGIQHTQR